jgi:parallel beta-helix repeat protein
MQKNPYIINGLAVGIIFLFIGTCIIPVMAQTVEKPSVVSNGHILYVGGSGPGNYTKIQDAINDSHDGDTVFVYDDVSPYHEFLSINTSISLIGEEKNTTIINADNESKIVIQVTADGVTISGFTVVNYGREAILIESNNTHISDIILGPRSGWSGNGIRLFHSHDSLIEENDISHTFNAIEIIDSDRSIIRRNHLTSSYLYGIWLSNAAENTIIDNIVDTGDPVGLPGSYNGIRLWDCTNNTVSGNLIVSRDIECRVGLELWDSRDNLVKENTFETCGFFWYGSYENILENNTVNNNPLVFLIGKPHSTIDHAGQVILIQCDDSIVRDVEITNVPKAIEILNSDNCIVTNTTSRNNDYGIYFESSKNIQVTKNKIFTTQIGISAEQGSQNASITENVIQESLYMGIYSNAASTTIEKNTLTGNSVGILTGGLFSLKIIIQSNRITDNWDGITLYSPLTTVRNNSIAGNVNGIHISGAYRNMIISNNITGNECGVNITYEPGSLRSIGNWILKNNFLGNTRHAFFDSAVRTHWIRNYWQGDLLSPARIDGMKSYYKLDVWGGVVWQKHIPWVNFDWFSSQKPYDI